MLDERSASNRSYQGMAGAGQSQVLKNKKIAVYNVNFYSQNERISVRKSREQGTKKKVTRVVFLLEEIEAGVDLQKEDALEIGLGKRKEVTGKNQGRDHARDTRKVINGPDLGKDTGHDLETGITNTRINGKGTILKS